MQEIPTSFLADECVRFYLTERNNEDMEGFNDVWANILNDDLLNKRDILTPMPTSPMTTNNQAASLRPSPHRTVQHLQPQPADHSIASEASSTLQ